MASTDLDHEVKMLRYLKRHIVFSMAWLVLPLGSLSFLVSGCLGNAMLHSARALPAGHLRIGGGLDYHRSGNLETNGNLSNDLDTFGLFLQGRVGLGSGFEVGLEYLLPFNGISADAMWQFVGDSQSLFSLAVDFDFLYINQQMYDDWGWPGEHRSTRSEYFYNMFDLSPSIISSIRPLKWLDIYLAARGMYRFDQVEKLTHVIEDGHEKNYLDVKSYLVGPVVGLQFDLADAFSWRVGPYFIVESQVLWRVGGDKLPFDEPQTHTTITVGGGVHF